MIINKRSQGVVREIDNNTAQQEAAAKRVLDARQTMNFATPEEMPRLQDKHDTHMADLVALHEGDQGAAEATLSGVAWMQSRGKR
jgi:hypothetical protein